MSDVRVGGLDWLAAPPFAVIERWEFVLRLRHREIARPGTTGTSPRQSPCSSYIAAAERSLQRKLIGPIRITRSRLNRHLITAGADPVGRSAHRECTCCGGA